MTIKKLPKLNVPFYTDLASMVSPSLLCGLAGLPGCGKSAMLSTATIAFAPEEMLFIEAESGAFEAARPEGGNPAVCDWLDKWKTPNMDPTRVAQVRTFADFQELYIEVLCKAEEFGIKFVGIDSLTMIGELADLHFNTMDVTRRDKALGWMEKGAWFSEYFATMAEVPIVHAFTVHVKDKREEVVMPVKGTDAKSQAKQQTAVREIDRQIVPAVRGMTGGVFMRRVQLYPFLVRRGTGSGATIEAWSDTNKDQWAKCRGDMALKENDWCFGEYLLHAGYGEDQRGAKKKKKAPVKKPAAKRKSPSSRKR